MRYEVRKWVSHVEEIVHDGGSPADAPLTKAAVGIVIKNPFAGRFQGDLSEITIPSGELGAALGNRARTLLGGRPVAAYGKGGIAGVDGEQEHVVACITSVFGDALRDAVGGGEAWISSVTKVGTAGEPIDIPLAHKDALYVRSHYDAITLRDVDSPRPGEILVCVAVSAGARVHGRSGGLKPEDIAGGGLR